MNTTTPPVEEKNPGNTDDRPSLAELLQRAEELREHIDRHLKRHPKRGSR